MELFLSFFGSGKTNHFANLEMITKESRVGRRKGTYSYLVLTHLDDNKAQDKSKCYKAKGSSIMLFCNWPDALI